MDRIIRLVKFMITAMLIAVITVVVAKIPLIFIDVYKYCTIEDKGYMWVINIISAAIVAVAIRLLTRKKSGSVILAISTFILCLPAAELTIWHREYIWSVISIELPKESWIAFGVGIMSAVIAYVLELKEE